MLRTGRLSFIVSSAAVMAMLNACGASGPLAGEVQPASEVTAVSLVLPAKDQLPAGVADHLTHYHFTVRAATVGQAASPNGCAHGGDQISAYATSTTLEAKLNSQCHYFLSLVLGKPDANGKLEIPAPANVCAPAEGDAKLPPQKPLPEPQTLPNSADQVYYFAEQSLAPEQMAGQSKLSLTLEMQKFTLSGDCDDTTLPDTLPIGKDLDLEVNVKFPTEGDSGRRPESQIP